MVPTYLHNRKSVDYIDQMKPILFAKIRSNHVKTKQAIDFSHCHVHLFERIKKFPEKN